LEPRTEFPYRLAAIDLDDTLLGPDKRISAANRAAVQQLRSLGVQVVLASGRCHANMVGYHQELGLEGLVISSQGALVRHAETGETLHQHLIDPELARAAIARGEAQGFSVVVYHPEASYVRIRDAYTKIYEQRTSNRLLQVDRWEEHLAPGVLKVLWLGSEARIAAQLPEVRSAWEDRLEMLITDPEYLELMPHGVSKEVGLEAAVRHYGLTADRTLAFGDGHNDVTMLRWAGLGVAMSHGRESARQAADRVAPPGDPETEFARAVAVLVG
jgi:Cof subfamily protein (haloacid dehalogenase superfamily)